MELALTVLVWTASVSLALTTIMGISAIAARTKLDEARAASERRMHG